MEEIALGICAILVLDLPYYAALQVIDYAEKGINKKMYPIDSIGFWKFVMIRYTRKIEATREEEEAKRGTKREKDPINASTISRLSFWLQMLNFVFVVTLIVLGIKDVVSPTNALRVTVKILRIIFVVLIPVPTIIAIIKREKMFSKRQKN